MDMKTNKVNLCSPDNIANLKYHLGGDHVKISESQAQKILLGSVQYKFNQLGFNMLIARLITIYKKNPTSVVLTQCTKEMNDFIAKFSMIMKQDYDLISKL